MAAISLILCTYALVKKYQNTQSIEEKEQEGVISVSLSTDKSTYRKLEPIVVNIVLKNNGVEPVGILKWHTPIEAVEIPCLNVLYRTRGIGAKKTQVDYQGPLKVQIDDEPDADDYFIVPVGETLDMSIDLLLYYDLYSTGVYHVTYNNDLTALVSNTMQFKITD